MKPEEDAFGQKLWAAYSGEEVYEVAERDDGYIDAMDIKGYFAPYEAWSPAEQKVMECVKGRILDVGCGAGRHSLYLQEKGFDVLGIDISPLAVKICKLRGLKKVEEVSLEAVGQPQGLFDTIIMMGNNFGLFGGFEKARSLLRELHAITSKEALIIASTRDPYKTDNPAHLAYHKLNMSRGRMGGQVRIRSRFRSYTGRWFDYLMVSKEEMGQILHGLGWRIGSFIDSEAASYIAIIQKI
ncbi:MAG: class I SAM-dependent methyltransferase [Candidatus Bathyarchaeota archaeon]|jgi:SAM-dependent methyltransferase|nr:class I SAM-dependent methyltransferase [Candidatus Bathyarchaeota archaeon]